MPPLKNRTEVKSKNSVWLLEVELSQGLNMNHGSLLNALLIQVCKRLLLLVKLYQ